MFRQPPRLPDNPTPAQLETYQTECITHLAEVMDDDRKQLGAAILKLQDENAELRREIAQVRQFGEFEKSAPTHVHHPHGVEVLYAQRLKTLVGVFSDLGWLDRDFMDTGTAQGLMRWADRSPSQFAPDGHKHDH